MAISTGSIVDMLRPALDGAMGRAGKGVIGCDIRMDDNRLTLVVAHELATRSEIGNNDYKRLFWPRLNRAMLAHYNHDKASRKSNASDSPAPQGDGAPDDLITISRSALVGALVAEMVEFFDAPFSGVPTLPESEALWIASGGVERALREH